MAVDANTALEFVRLYGPLALLAFTFLETSMLFPFLPSEVVVPAAAALLVEDVPSFLVFVGAAGAGGTVGGFVPFYAFRASRSRDTGRIRAAVRVSDDSLDRSRRWFLRWGQSSVLWGRFLPGLRSVVSVPAGLAGMSPSRFGVYTAVGTVGFYAAVGGLVYYGQQRSLFAAVAASLGLERPALAAGALVAVLVVGLSGWGWYRRRASR